LRITKPIAWKKPAKGNIFAHCRRFGISHGRWWREELF